MPSVMEKPSAGSGILSRSRAKTAPNGGQPPSEDDSSEEEHSHGEPRGPGLKAPPPPADSEWGAGRGGERGRPLARYTDGSCPPWLEPVPCFSPKPGAAGTESGGWAPSCPPAP